MNDFLISLLQVIYPLDLPDKRRDRPLEVIALGLSRTGTDSLRQALVELGYDDVYHGFSFGSSHNQQIQWIRLSHAQNVGNKALLNATEFDRILGDCAAVTDIPAAGFAKELVAAYPDAKIIVNYREDVDAWVTSVMNSIEKVATSGQPWGTYLMTWFEPSLFWRQHSYWYVWTKHFGGDFQRNGKGWYLRHYRELEQMLPKGSYLKWKAEDGWEPLCKFLGKPVPQRPFPSGNVPEDFIKKTTAFKMDSRKRAQTNMMLFGAFLSLTVAAVAMLVRI